MYDGDITWADAVNDCSNICSSNIATLTRSHERYLSWQTFRAGRTNAQIATALSVTETAVAEMDAAFAAGEALYQCANNVATGQADRLYAFRKFS